MNGRPPGDWIALIFLLTVVAGLVLTHFLSLLRNRYTLSGMHFRAGVLYWLLGSTSLFGMTLYFMGGLGPEWVRFGLVAVNLPILLTFLPYAIFGEEVVRRIVLLPTLLVILFGEWLFTDNQPNKARVACFGIGYVIGFMILWHRKRIVADYMGPMVEVQIIEDIVVKGGELR